MKVTCKYFKNGRCEHPRAPVLPWYKQILGKISCILYNNADIRIADCKFRESIKATPEQPEQPEQPPEKK